MAMTVDLLHFGQPRRRRRRHGRTFLAARDELHSGDGVGYVGEVSRVQLTRVLIRLLLLLLLVTMTENDTSAIKSLE